MTQTFLAKEIKEANKSTREDGLWSRTQVRDEETHRTVKDYKFDH